MLNIQNQENRKLFVYCYQFKICVSRYYIRILIIIVNSLQFESRYLALMKTKMTLHRQVMTDIYFHIRLNVYFFCTAQIDS